MGIKTGTRTIRRAGRIHARLPRRNDVDERRRPRPALRRRSGRYRRTAKRGRGQRGNSWSSSAGANLTFSVVLCPGFLETAQQFYLSKAVSLAVCDTVELRRPAAGQMAERHLHRRTESGRHFDRKRFGGKFSFPFGRGNRDQRQPNRIRSGLAESDIARSRRGPEAGQGGSF